eukprot:9443819-Pyramimonas_sp.AAC.1
MEGNFDSLLSLAAHTKRAGRPGTAGAGGERIETTGAQNLLPNPPRVQAHKFSELRSVVATRGRTSAARGPHP